MRLQARKMMGALLVVTLCTGWLLPAFAEESPGVFREAFSKIIKNYVEQPDPSYLALSAVNRMEEFLHANNKSITNIAIDDRAIGKDAKRAENLVADTYAIWSKSIPLGTRQLEYAAIEGMLAALDPHSNFLTPQMYKELQVDTRGTFAGIGIEISVVKGILTVVSPIENTPRISGRVKGGRSDHRNRRYFDSGHDRCGSCKKVEGADRLKGDSHNHAQWR